MLTKEQVAEIKALADKATPGPWMENNAWQSRGIVMADGKVRTCNNIKPNDVTFIAAARADVPVLCETIEELRSLLYQVRGNCMDAGCNVCGESCDCDIEERVDAVLE